MTFLPRSHYELGDPVAEVIARDERSDHHRATARGQRLLLIADSVVSRLDWRLQDPTTARGEIFHVLADALYGPAVAIDLPDFASERSLEALRRGRAV